MTAEPEKLKHDEDVTSRAWSKTDRDKTKAISRAQKEKDMVFFETIKIAETEKNNVTTCTAQQDDAKVAIDESKAETRKYGSEESGRTAVNNKGNMSFTTTYNLSSYDKNGIKSTPEADTANHKFDKKYVTRIQIGNRKYSNKQNQDPL